MARLRTEISPPLGRCRGRIVGDMAIALEQFPARLTELYLVFLEAEQNCLVFLFRHITAYPADVRAALLGPLRERLRER